MKEEKMDTTSFCYWLQGYFELSESKMLSSRQVQIIKDHLALVFNKVTPDRKENNAFGIDAQEEVKKLLLDSTPQFDLDNTRLCSSEQNLESDKPGCETAQRFGLGKFNIRKPTIYC